jgi:hypothetical protein
VGFSVKTITLIASLAVLAFAIGGAYALSRGGDRVARRELRTLVPPLAKCLSRPADQRPDCYTAAFRSLTRDGGVAPALAALKTLGRADRAAERSGHVYAHGIGIEAYRHRRETERTFAECTTDFASGCKHGVIQAYLEAQTSVDSATINALCAPYRVTQGSTWQLFQCAHGMGHGLDMMYSGDLPKALAACDLLVEAWDRDSCFGGAFMENIVAEVAPHHPSAELVVSHQHHANFKRLDSADLLYPCSIMEPRHLIPCYQIQTTAILHFTDGSYRKTAEACERAPRDLIPICYQSLGRDIAGRVGRHPGKVRNRCGKTGAEFRPWCYYGAAKAVIDWEADTDEAMAFCASLGDQTGRARCYRAVGEQIKALFASEAERASQCAAATRPDGVGECRIGAELERAS